MSKQMLYVDILDENTNDLFPRWVILLPEPELGLLLKLRLIARNKWGANKFRSQILELINATPSTYKRQLRSLIAKRLVRIDVLSSNKQILTLSSLTSEARVTNHKEIIKLLNNEANTNKPENNPHPFTAPALPLVSTPLYNIEGSNKNNSNNKLVDSNKLSSKVRSKNKVKRFSKESYDAVVRAYERIKQVTLAGTDRTVAKRSVRNILLANHTVPEIIKCMEWFEANKTDSKFEWLEFWTLNTVAKWLPDFKAGRLKTEGEISNAKRVIVTQEDRERMQRLFGRRKLNSTNIH